MQCAELAEKLAADLQGEGLKGKTLTLKLKATTFEVWQPVHCGVVQPAKRPGIVMFQASLLNFQCIWPSSHCSSYQR